MKMLHSRLRLVPMLSFMLAAAASTAPAADELRQQALAGDVEKQLLLADDYLFGRNRPGNQSLAAYWYRRAAEQGSAAGEYNLGCCYEYGWGVEKCRHQALALYSRAAERGLAAAAVRRARLIYSGIPEEELGERRFEALPPDRKAGLQELRRAGDAGFAPAKLELALLLFDDPALRREHTEEIGKLAREAAGAPDATVAAKLFYARCLRHGIGMTPDPARALQLYREAAEHGDPSGMAAFGRMLEFGMGGAAPDPARALELYQKAAELNDPSGMVFLGDRLLADGDTEAACAWYTRAAKLDFPPACAKAGDCHSFGWGTAPDPQKGFAFYEQGAKLGDSNSQYKLGKCLAEGRGTKQDPAAAVFWYKCAGANGSRDAVRELGATLLFGRNVPPDPAEGRRLLEAAAQAGDAEAAAILNGQGK